MFGKRRPRDRLQMQFTSMIDVVFLLLIFFMCTLKFKSLESKITAHLPLDRGPQTTYEELEPIEPMRIALSMRGSTCICALNGRSLGAMPDARGALYRRLEALRRASPNSPAEIAPDPTVSHGHVITVLDECMRADVGEVRFAAALPPLKRRS